MGYLSERQLDHFHSAPHEEREPRFPNQYIFPLGMATSTPNPKSPKHDKPLLYPPWHGFLRLTDSFFFPSMLRAYLPGDLQGPPIF